MYQKIILLGNVGRDAPAMRYTADGTPVTSFSMATNETWRSGDDKKQRTTWWRVSCWRKQAEIVSQYVTPGMQVLVEGTITPGDDGSPRTWTGQDGITRASYELRADVVRFVGGRSSDEAPSQDTPVRSTEATGMPF